MGLSGIGNATSGGQSDIQDTVDAIPIDSYFEQNIPLVVNSTQTLNNTEGDKPFIASDTRGAQGLISTDDDKVQKVFLCIVGLAVNNFVGSNDLDCTNAVHNQWQINLNGGSYSDLDNSSNLDGQMLDDDWLCHVEGANFGYSLMFDVTSQITDIDGNIGLQLKDGKSEAASFVVTLSAYLKVLWKL